MPHLTRSLTIGLIASISCRSESIVQPIAGIQFDRSEAAEEASIRVQRVRVKSLANGDGIAGSYAVLRRAEGGLAVFVKTRSLAPNETVDVFWAIFNNPAACMHPNALTGAPCSPADLFVAGTRSSLHYVATPSADARGKLSYDARLEVRSADGCVGDPFPCHGLTNPFGAEVHSALFVPNGGPSRQAAQFFYTEPRSRERSDR